MAWQKIAPSDWGFSFTASRLASLFNKAEIWQRKDQSFFWRDGE